MNETFVLMNSKTQAMLCFLTNVFVSIDFTHRSNVAIFILPSLLSDQVNSPYLEEHLMHMIKQDQSKVHNMDLLWRYYEKNRNFGKAAHVLARLADMHRFG